MSKKLHYKSSKIITVFVIASLIVLSIITLTSLIVLNKNKQTTSTKATTTHDCCVVSSCGDYGCLPNQKYVGNKGSYSSVCSAYGLVDCPVGNTPTYPNGRCYTDTACSSGDQEPTVMPENVPFPTGCFQADCFSWDTAGKKYCWNYVQNNINSPIIIYHFYTDPCTCPSSGYHLDWGDVCSEETIKPTLPTPTATAAPAPTEAPSLLPYSADIFIINKRDGELTNVKLSISPLFMTSRTIDLGTIEKNGSRGVEYSCRGIFDFVKIYLTYYYQYNNNGFPYSSDYYQNIWGLCETSFTFNVTD